MDAAYEVEPFLSEAEARIGAQPVLDTCSGPTVNIPIGGAVTTAGWAARYPRTARVNEVMLEVLADKGYFPVAELDRFCHFDSILGGHPEVVTPGVEACTGALGHGLPIGIGLALAARIQRRDSRVVVLMGDGEINEGSVWEAAACADKHRLGNLTAIIDYNKLQSAGSVFEIQNMEPLADKWASFGFQVLEANGHDVADLRRAFAHAMALPPNQPRVIICHTVKGKGIPAAENNASWHHKAELSDDVRQAIGLDSED